jgi:hypothetical protein
MASLGASLRIKVTFKEANGTVIKTVEGNEGDDLLSIAHEYDVDLEGTSYSCLHLICTAAFKARPQQDANSVDPPSRYVRHTH